MNPISDLIPLFDGRAGLRAQLSVSVSAPSEAGTPSTASPTLDFVASDESLDRYGEIISAGGWNLENYRRNPVFQNAHQYGDILHTLGKALITEVRSGSARPHLFQRVEFAIEVNPVARIAYGLYKGGFLNAVSVGFIPLRWETSDDDSAGGTNSRASRATLPCRRKYLEQELLEVSAVAIPANPAALALGLKSGAIDRSDLEETLELISRSEDQGPGGTGLCHAVIFQLARELRRLLRRS